MRSSQTYKNSWTLESKTLTEHLIISILKDPLQGTVNDCQKLMTKKEFSRQHLEKKTVPFKENPIRLSLGFSGEIVQARRE